MVALFYLMPFVLIVIGIWHLTIPLDPLWQRHERQLLAQGLAPQRNEVWEQRVRRNGWALVIAGSMLLVIFGAVWFSSPPQMSNFSIGDHRLTQAEYDSCDHDDMNCLMQYAPKKGR